MNGIRLRIHIKYQNRSDNKLFIIQTFSQINKHKNDCIVLNENFKLNLDFLKKKKTTTAPQ